MSRQCNSFGRPSPPATAMRKNCGVPGGEPDPGRPSPLSSAGARGLQETAGRNGKSAAAVRGFFRARRLAGCVPRVERGTAMIHATPAGMSDDDQEKLEDRRKRPLGGSGGRRAASVRGTISHQRYAALDRPERLKVQFHHRCARLRGRRGSHMPPRGLAVFCTMQVGGKSFWEPPFVDLTRPPEQFTTLVGTWPSAEQPRLPPRTAARKCRVRRPLPFNKRVKNPKGGLFFPQGSVVFPPPAVFFGGLGRGVGLDCL